MPPAFLHPYALRPIRTMRKKPAVESCRQHTDRKRTWRHGQYGSCWRSLHPMVQPKNGHQEDCHLRGRYTNRQLRVPRLRILGIGFVSGQPFKYRQRCVFGMCHAAGIELRWQDRQYRRLCLQRMPCPQARMPATDIVARNPDWRLFRLFCPDNGAPSRNALIHQQECF